MVYPGSNENTHARKGIHFKIRRKEKMSNGELIKMTRFGGEGVVAQRCSRLSSLSPWGGSQTLLNPPPRDQSHHSEVVKCCLKLVQVSQKALTVSVNKAVCCPL